MGSTTTSVYIVVSTTIIKLEQFFRSDYSTNGPPSRMRFVRQFEILISNGPTCPPKRPISKILEEHPTILIYSTGMRQLRSKPQSSFLLLIMGHAESHPNGLQSTQIVEVYRSMAHLMSCSFWLGNTTRPNEQETLAQLLSYEHGEIQVKHEKSSDFRFGWEHAICMVSRYQNQFNHTSARAVLP